MKCPHCGFTAPDGSAECPKCQVVFSKLEERAVRKAVLEHAELMREPAAKASPLTIRLFVMFLITAALWYLAKPKEENPAQAAAPAQVQSAQPAAEASASDAQQPAATSTE